MALPVALGLWPGAPAEQTARIVLGAALGSLVYGVIVSGWRTVAPESVRTAFFVAVLARLALLTLPPLLSEDLWRYLWDGATQWAGRSPYALAPAEPALDAWAAGSATLTDIRARIGHAEIPTIYPPPAQLVFAVAGWAGPSAGLWRACASAAELGAALALWAWLRRTGRDPRAVLLWLYCPLPAVEAAVGAHVDAVGVLGLTAAGWLTVRGRAGAAGMALVLAVGTKLFPVVALLRARGRTVLACALVFGLSWLPFLGTTPGAALSTYGHRWRGNDGLFAAFVGAFEVVWPPDGPPPAMPAWVTQLGRLLVGPDSAGGASSLWPPELAFAAAKVVSAALLGTVALTTWRRTRAGDWPALLGPFTAALLLVSPVVHPWYLLWWLPFAVLAAADGQRALAWPFFVWSGTIWVAYVPRVTLLATGRWVENPILTVLEYLPVWIALVIAARGTVNTAPRGLAGRAQPPSPG
ncbi:glycosyltransferase 87 family protein [Myxococcota bacterium]|nr:glycosyltransferase 87 family protein [Myxococcota bacterium]